MTYPDSEGNDPVLHALREAEAVYQASAAEMRREREAQAKEAAAQRRRADDLARMLKRIHGAVFSGDLYEHILRACLSLTGAARGLYVTGEGHDGSLRVQAAVDMDVPTGATPPAFIAHLCAEATERGDTVVSSPDADPADIAHPGPSPFRNFMAAPVALLRGFSGVVVAADKEGGEFDERDAQMLVHIGDQAGVAVENSRLRQNLQNAYLATVSVLADAMEAKDPYTQGHCEMVSRYARRIGQRLDLPPRELGVVAYAALLHDIGKIGVSDGILNKPGPLLPEERDLVRSHVRIGHDLIRHVPALAHVAEAVMHHHEWFDGTGYPDGLRADRIPLASRIVCVVDSYGAMISRRSYKEAYGEDYARQELRRCAGTQFDPIIVSAFLEVLDEPELPEGAGDAHPGSELLSTLLSLDDPAHEGK